MPIVWIPPLLRSFTANQESLPVAGATLGEVIDALDASFPGLKGRLCTDGSVKPSLSVVIDGQVNREGLSAAVKENSEVHFIPAIGGGQSSVGRPWKTDHEKRKSPPCRGFVGVKSLELKKS